MTTETKSMETETTDTTNTETTTIHFQLIDNYGEYYGDTGNITLPTEIVERFMIKGIGYVEVVFCDDDGSLNEERNYGEVNIVGKTNEGCVDVRIDGFMLMRTTKDLFLSPDEMKETD